MSALTADARRYFDAPNIGHLATVLPDGSPHSVPVWVDMQGERIAFLTSPRSRKARNLKREPRLAVSVTKHDEPNSMALVRGHIVEVLDGDKAWTIIDRMSHKYLGQPYPLRTDRVLFLVEVDHAWMQGY
jgi:PPOX class probable F420-dependent enzyme